MKTFSPIVRLFSYEDPHYSRGDRYTFKYVKMTEDCFVGEVNTAFNGESYTIWNYTQKGLDLVKSIKGYDHYCMGFEFTTQAKMDEEVSKLESKLNMIKQIVVL